MKRQQMKQAIPAILISTAAAVPAGTVLAAHTTAPAAKAKSHTYKGSLEQMRWGPVQVSIVVKSKKITNVKAAVQPDTSRSEFIQSDALPILKSEVLKAQSADIDEVSGATDISDAYMTSLQAAIDSAKKHKALK